MEEKEMKPKKGKALKIILIVVLAVILLAAAAFFVVGKGLLGKIGRVDDNGPTLSQEEIDRFREALDALLDPDVDVQRKNRLLKACIERIDYHREAPQRIKKPNKQKGKRVTINGKRVYVPVPDPQTEHWTNTPIEIDVKLRV